MGRKEFLLEQLRACHNENGWFVSLQSALKELNDADATQKGAEGTNSIGEIINHLLFWNTIYLNRFRGLNEAKVKINNDQTFENQMNLDWFSTVEKLNKVLSEWEVEILRCEENKFDQAPPNNPNGTWWEVLSNIPIHNAYHIGQIIQIRKEQGNWSSQYGVH